MATHSGCATPNDDGPLWHLRMLSRSNAAAERMSAVSDCRATRLFAAMARKKSPRSDITRIAANGKGCDPPRAAITGTDSAGLTRTLRPTRDIRMLGSTRRAGQTGSWKWLAAL
jgi:hypothetical protein